MRTLETPRRFSESMFWRLMVDYYRGAGVTAWQSGAVPHQVSSNPFIANAYAQIILGYLRDAVASAENETVVILELGAGLGQFGFLLATALDRAVADEPPRSVAAFRYVMTDVAESNVRAWTEHPRLKPLIERGLIEVAVLDAGALAAARLVPSGRSLHDAIGGAPVVVVANYLLDVLVHDAFAVEDGTLSEVRVGLEANDALMQNGALGELFRTMHFRQERTPVHWPYYPERVFDDILREYECALHSAVFLFPVVGLRCLDALRRMAGGRLLLLVSDKARIAASQLEGRLSLSMALSGSFATTVNLDAIARWTRRAGGTVHHQPVPNEHFDTYAFVLGNSSRRSDTARAFRRYACDFSPSVFWSLARELHAGKAELGPRAMLALIRLGCFDPHLIEHAGDQLLAAASSCRDDERKVFVDALERVWSNAFPVAGRHDIAFTLARLFRRLGRPERALELYRASIETHGPHCSTLGNMGACHEALGDEQAALAAYRAALELRADDDLIAAVARLAPVTDTRHGDPAQHCNNAAAHAIHE